MADERAFDQALDGAAIAAGLAALPRWAHLDGALQRRYATTSFKASLMVTATVGQLCEAAWHHPELVVAYSGVTVRLWTHTAKGITAKDFELAAQIERVICWQPRGPDDGGALMGPPDRHAILRPDQAS